MYHYYYFYMALSFTQSTLPRSCGTRHKRGYAQNPNMNLLTLPKSSIGLDHQVDHLWPLRRMSESSNAHVLWYRCLCDPQGVLMQSVLKRYFTIKVYKKGTNLFARFRWFCREFYSCSKRRTIRAYHVRAQHTPVEHCSSLLSSYT